MSYTGRYSPFYPYDEQNVYNVETEFTTHGCGVRITDLDRLEELIPETLLNQAVITEYTDTNEYPNQVWKQFNGFVTFGSDEIDNRPRYYNVSKLGWRYSQNDFIQIMEDLSACLDPFFVWHYAGDSYFPSFMDLIGGEERVYRIEGDGDGNILVFEMKIGQDVATDGEVDGMFVENVVYDTEMDD